MSAASTWSSSRPERRPIRPGSGRRPWPISGSGSTPSRRPCSTSRGGRSGPAGGSGPGSTGSRPPWTSGRTSRRSRWRSSGRARTDRSAAIPRAALRAEVDRAARAMASLGVEPRRSGRDLHAHDSRDGGRGPGRRQAGRDLHPHLLGLRGAGGGQPAGRLRGEAAHHRGRILAAREGGGHEVGGRCGAGRCADRGAMPGRSPVRDGVAGRALDRGPRRGVGAGADGGRGRAACRRSRPTPTTRTC